MGGDFDDVFRGVGVGGLEVCDYGFVEYFSSRIKDFCEACLGGGEGVAEFEEGFGDGAGGGAGEAHDADAATPGWGGDGYDGVFGTEFCFAHLDFSMLAGEKNPGGALWCFSGVFAKTVVQNVAFWWCDRGGLRGKRGV